MSAHDQAIGLVLGLFPDDLQPELHHWIFSLMSVDRPFAVDIQGDCIVMSFPATHTDIERTVVFDLADGQPNGNRDYTNIVAIIETCQPDKSRP